MPVSPPIPVNSPVAGSVVIQALASNGTDGWSTAPIAVEQRGGGEPAPAQLEQPVARLARVGARECVATDRHASTVPGRTAPLAGAARPRSVRLAPGSPETLQLGCSPANPGRAG